ncbi:uncharacterized protein [Macrobrachium rosenbergii]|uniref:uncharacterized protein n=1 Tax=Macrobrachium rosenbergii TaxID=79674 RepID=UPI0034D66679
MSAHTWGEDPRGIWKLEITDMTAKDEHGTIGEIKLVLHGTKDVPEHLQRARSYKIPFEEDAEDSKTDEEGLLSRGLTAEALRTLPWEKLVELLQHRTRSTFSGDDLRLLLRENRLHKALQNVQSEHNRIASYDSDWRTLLDEVLSRK